MTTILIIIKTDRVPIPINLLETSIFALASGENLVTFFALTN